MDNLIKDTATLELFCWLDPGTELPGWDILNGSPFGASLAAPQQQQGTDHGFLREQCCLIDCRSRCGGPQGQQH